MGAVLRAGFSLALKIEKLFQGAANAPFISFDAMRHVVPFRQILFSVKRLQVLPAVKRPAGHVGTNPRFASLVQTSLRLLII